MRKLTKDVFFPKMYRMLSERLRLSDRQIVAALAAMTEIWSSRSPWCHAEFYAEGHGRVWEVPDADAFRTEHVTPVDKTLLPGLAQYENMGCRHYVLFSSPHGSLLWAAGGRQPE